MISLPQIIADAAEAKARLAGMGSADVVYHDELFWLLKTALPKLIEHIATLTEALAETERQRDVYARAWHRGAGSPP